MGLLLHDPHPQCILETLWKTEARCKDFWAIVEVVVSWSWLELAKEADC